MPGNTSKAEQNEEDSDQDSLGDAVVIRISQSAQSRPESSILEITGDLHSAPEKPSDSPRSNHTPQDTPPVPHVPPPPPPQEDELQSPDGFLSMQFKIKKRPRGGLGVTLVASEGLTTGFFMVRRVSPNGVAAKDGRLQIGDRLVSVNGVSLFDMAHAAVLQTLNDARKEVAVVVWRDPHHTLASSSMHSLGSYSNLSGSHSSLLSEDFNEDGSPSLGAVKRRHTRGLSSPTARDSPLTARSSYAGLPASLPKESPADKRWSDGDVLASLSHVSSELIHEDSTPTNVPESVIPPETAVPPNVPESMLPPDLPETAVPPNLPECMIPLDLPETTVPPNLLFPSDLPETLALTPEVPTSLPPEVTSQFFAEVTSVLPEIPSNMAPAESPKVMVPSSPSPKTLNPDCKKLSPSSLQVPRDGRTEKSPFEIEFKKGLFGIGVDLTVNAMGMLVISSLSARSIISQDGNIK